MRNAAGLKNDSKSRKRPLKDGELLLSYKGLTALTGYSEATIRRMTKARLIPFVRIGRSVRFPKDDILNWIEAHKVPAV
jgi:excisionase family DNA binding protein